MRTSILDTPLPHLDRRALLRSVSLLTAAGLIEPQLVAGVLAGERHIGRLAVQSPSAEGIWTSLKVEGQIPKDLNGTLYRVAPGQKTNHGVQLQHFFDGDAFLTRYRLREGSATVSARFIQTPERQEETAAGKMLYSEFGTHAPVPEKGGKNQPSINVIRWDGRLLALSEGGHPSAGMRRRLHLKSIGIFTERCPKMSASPRIPRSILRPASAMPLARIGDAIWR
jgi:Retinal pigment epithelial membrane protein